MRSTSLSSLAGVIVPAGRAPFGGRVARRGNRPRSHARSALGLVLVVAGGVLAGAWWPEIGALGREALRYVGDTQLLVYMDQQGLRMGCP